MKNNNILSHVGLEINDKKLKYFIDPIISKKAGFTKGNRFSDLSFIENMPTIRIIGNILFSIL